MLLNLVFWFLGGSGTGLVPHITKTTTLVKYSSSLVTGLELIIFNLVIDFMTNT
jgi:hypothetical protein